MYVYILLSEADNSQYIGMTHDLKERLSYHNNGKVKSTKSKKPWKMIYFEQFDTIALARNREKYLKSAAGRKFRKTINYDGLSSVG